MKHYRSSIPKAAKERVVATRRTGPQRYKVNCILDGKVVGVRYFHPTGELAEEYPLKNGLTHGVVYHSTIPGKLHFAEPYHKGLPHGKARQWSDDGKLIGSYTMVQGTGIDLWRSERSNGGGVYLAEARYIKNGKWDGFEWWLTEDRKVMAEQHFSEGQRHGIERSWNADGRPRRGFPRYWVNDVQVTKPQYLRASAKDKTLPRFREKDNRPQRKFPPEVSAHLV
jgi:hypothetical protein